MVYLRLKILTCNSDTANAWASYLSEAARLVSISSHMQCQSSMPPPQQIEELKEQLRKKIPESEKLPGEGDATL